MGSRFFRPLLTTFVLVAFTSTGCSLVASSDTSPAEYDPLLVAAQLALAEDDLDSRVRQIIEQAASTGTLSYEDYKEGLRVYVECMSGVGVEAKMHETKSFGVPTVMFGERYMPGVILDDDEYRALRMLCINSSYLPIESVYQSQMSVEIRKTDRMNLFLPALSDCLAAQTAFVPDNPTFDELMQTVSQVEEESEVACDVETGFRETQVFPVDFWEQ